MFESVVANVLNKFLGDYVENFQANQLNIAIWNGDVKLKNLRLKQEALDKIKLPMHFNEGYLGELTMKIPWHNLKNQPIKIFINNVYLLISPKDAIDLDPEEEEERAQKLKQDKLEATEMVRTKSKNASHEDELKQASFTTQLVTKIVDNLQISIKNIHLRYEDTISNPEHPFAIGVTLSEMSAISTDENWQEAIIDEASKVIHKLLTLKSLGMYWNTDSTSLGGKKLDAAIEAFMQEISSDQHQLPNHQFILKPVSATGKLILTHDGKLEKPKNSAGLEFDEFGFVLDDEQYRDLMLVTTMFDLVMRKQKYVKYIPPRGKSYSEEPLAWFRFAAKCVIAEIHESRMQWSWDNMAERMVDRKKYIDLYIKHKVNGVEGHDLDALTKLERKLKFRDLKFYRNLAQPEINRQKAIIQRKEEEAKKQPTWIGSLLGWTSTPTDHSDDSSLLSDDQMKKLYETIDYDEDNVLDDSVLPSDYVALVLNAQLKKGSFSLRSHPHSDPFDIITLSMSNFAIDFLQRTNSFKAKMTLNELELLDGSNAHSIYPQLVKVSEHNYTEAGEPDVDENEESVSSSSDPFFALTFEHNPLDGKSDDSLSVKMRNLQMIYNPKTIESINSFFKPPVQTYDSVTALIEAAGNKLEGLKKQTTATLQYALDEHRTLDVLVDIQAPLIIVPHSFTDPKALIVVLDSGHIFMDSQTIDKVKKEDLQKKHRDEFTEKDFKELESLMYDKFNVELNSVQLVVGNSLDECLVAIAPSTPAGSLHIIDRINMDFAVFLSILPEVSHLTKISVSGHLPLLQINVSDHKYKAIMSTLELLMPPGEATKDTKTNKTNTSKLNNQKSFAQLTSSVGLAELVYSQEDEPDSREDLTDENTETNDDDDEFYDAEDDTQKQIENKYKNLNQKLFVLDFKIDKLKASLRRVKKGDNYVETELADAHLDEFSLHFVNYPYHMGADVVIKKINIFDKLYPDSEFCHLITSEIGDMEGNEAKNLMQIAYIRASSESPEFQTRFEGIDQSLDVSFSALNVIVTQKTILSLYYFLLETFVTKETSSDSSSDTSEEMEVEQVDTSQSNATGPGSTTLIKTRMDSIQLILNDNGTKLASIHLTDGDLTILMTMKSLRLNTKLGNFLIIDETYIPSDDSSHNYSKLLSIDSKEVVEIRYENFNNKSVDLGYDSLVHIDFGVARILLIEDPLLKILNFFSRFAEMHYLFETARQAALNSATQLQEQVNRLQFDIKVKSPKIIIPRTSTSTDTVTANLGELKISNNFSYAGKNTINSQVLNNMKLNISSICLSSSIVFPDFVQSLQIIENIDIKLSIVLAEYVLGSLKPEREIAGSMTPVTMAVTREQYKLLLDIFNLVLRVIGVGGSSPDQAEDSIENLSKLPADVKAVKVQDVANKISETETDEDQSHVVMDVVFALEKVLLDVYDGEKPEKLAETKLAQVSLNNTNVKYLTKSDSSTELEAEIHSFVVLDTRTDYDYSFREIIPAITHEGPQFMAHMSTKPDAPSSTTVTIDSPKVVFAVDYLLAIQSFALSPFEFASQESEHSEDEDEEEVEPNQKIFNPDTSEPKPAKAEPEESDLNQPFNFRVNVVDAEVIVLADLKNPSSEAIVLSIQQVVLSRQGIFALTVDKIGMYLCQISQRQETALRFIDNFDIVLSMDDHQIKPGHHLTDIAIDIKPLILRLSYRDVILISDVLNKFSQLLYTTADESETQITVSEKTLEEVESKDPKLIRSVSTISSSKSANPTAYQVLSKETLRVSIQGIQVILIRDSYDLPIVDLGAEPFAINVSDWSSSLKAEAQVALTANFYNLKNSHWEPLIEPWSLSAMIAKPSSESFKVDLQSKKLLDLNLTPAIIETLVSFMEEIQTQNPLGTPRGVHVPYIIRNRTGYSMHVWGDTGGESLDVDIKHIEDGQDLPWRFDDWRKTRESVIQSRNSLGLQFEEVTWESVKDILVDQEGISTYPLRPLLMGVAHRMVCEVTLKDNVKIVTFRSPLLVHNTTLLPMELVVVDTKRTYLSKVNVIPPGEKCSVPIESAYRFGLLIRPSEGFGYNWSSRYLYWREFLIDAPITAISCPPQEVSDPAFHIQVSGKFTTKDPIINNYPCITFRLSAPLEIENLLPYDINFTFHDSNNNAWPTFLKQGGISPVHMFDIHQPLRLGLVISDTLYSTGSKLLNINMSKITESVTQNITLFDNAGFELILQATINPVPGSGGSFKISVFSPYLLLNKTGLDMHFRTQSANKQVRVPTTKDNFTDAKVKPFMFSYAKHETRKQAYVKIGPSEWSHPISFVASGSLSELVLKSTSRPEEIHLGVSIEDGLGKYHGTRLITFTPRFIVKNNLESKIHFREFTASTSEMASPGGRTPLYFISQNEEKLLTICYPGVNNLWSAPFKINTVGKVYVQLARANSSIELIKVSVQLQGATIFILLEKETGKWPFRIENLTETDVIFYQSSENPKSMVHYKEPNKYKLASECAVPYSWDFPSAEEKALTVCAGDSYRTIDFQQLGALIPFKFKADKKSMTMAIEVLAEGPILVLRMSRYIESESLFRPTRPQSTSVSQRTSSSFPATPPISGNGGERQSNQGFEIVEQEARVVFTFALKLEGIGLSLVNRRKQELIYATLRGLEFKFNDYTNSQSMNLKIKWIQVDNQLFGSLYPILLYPTVISKTGNESSLHPTLQVVATRSKDQNTGVMFFKYFTFLLQEISFEIDEDFLFALLDFVKYSVPNLGTNSEASEAQLYDSRLQIPEPEVNEDGLQVYFSLLHIQPLKLNLSFMRTERISQEEVQPTSHNPLTLLINVLTMAIGSINDAPIKFNALVLENLLATTPVLMDRFTSYYGQEFVYQIHKVVGSADVLGNPVGLFNNLSSGVVDIFYEPYQGFVMSDRPQDFGIGLARGTASFVKKTIFGFSDSFSKITESLGKGLAEVTMDRDFIDRRRLNKTRNRPKHALYGVAHGANSLGSSVASGLSGVVLQPIEGAERDGIGGFFRGVGKGLVGAVAKPMVGAFDLVSNVAEGIRNTTTVFDNDGIDRVRLPRYIAPDGILKPYSQREALGQQWLQELKEGKHPNECYLAHYDLHSAQTAVMLTTLRVMQIKLKNLTLEWEMPFTELQAVHLSNSGISLVGKGASMGPFIHIPELSSRKWFGARIDEVFDSYLASRRPME